jgi:hypothetical protein
LNLEVLELPPKSIIQAYKTVYDYSTSNETIFFEDLSLCGPKCIEGQECHRPCYLKKLRNGGCPTSPEPKYDPANYTNVDYYYYSTN